MKAITKSVFLIAVAIFVVIGSSGAYFSDSVALNTIRLTTSSWGGVLINEVYYDVDATHGGIEPDLEWIELYNPASYAVDISGFKILDNSTSTTLPDGSIIPAKGFAVVSNSANVWANWSIPESVLKIAFGGNKISLANTSDRVIIKNEYGEVVDQMSYGSDKTAFDPPCVDVPEGHSLSKVFRGNDNNLASDFIDTLTPTPGE